MNGDLFRSGFGPLINPRTRIERRWREFHVKNPHVGTELLRLANELQRAGAERVGVKALWESCRVNALIRTDSRPWKLDNSLTSIFGRWLIHTQPSLESVIETRRRRERVA